MIHSANLDNPTYLSLQFARLKEQFHENEIVMALLNKLETPKHYNIQTLKKLWSLLKAHCADELDAVDAEQGTTLNRLFDSYIKDRQLFEDMVGPLKKLFGNISDITPYLHGAQCTVNDETEPSDARRKAKAMLDSALLSLFVDLPRWGTPCANTQTYCTVGKFEMLFSGRSMAISLYERAYKHEAVGIREAIGWVTEDTDVYLELISQYQEVISPMYALIRQQGALFSILDQLKDALILKAQYTMLGPAFQIPAIVDETIEMHQKMLKNHLRQFITAHCQALIQQSCHELAMGSEDTVITSMVNNYCQQFERSMLFGIRRENLVWKLSQRHMAPEACAAHIRHGPRWTLGEISRLAMNSPLRENKCRLLEETMSHIYETYRHIPADELTAEEILNLKNALMQFITIYKTTNITRKSIISIARKLSLLPQPKVLEPIFHTTKELITVNLKSYQKQRSHDVHHRRTRSESTLFKPLPKEHEPGKKRPRSAPPRFPTGRES